jgi:2-amino-4-hydroxy-6-hydroxymethyldihydropteridine diphosphokinase
MEANTVHEVWLCLGSNIGNKRSNLAKSIEFLLEDGATIVSESAIYVSKSWGYKSKNDYYNICLLIETLRDPKSCLRHLREIEFSMGRIKNVDEYEDRIIDLDILLFDDLIINSDDLIVPHPKMQERMFVLKPLAEIAPEKLHPIEKKTIKQLVEECKDVSLVHRVF